MAKTMKKIYYILVKFPPYNIYSREVYKTTRQLREGDIIVVYEGLSSNMRVGVVSNSDMPARRNVDWIVDVVSLKEYEENRLSDLKVLEIEAEIKMKERELYDLKTHLLKLKVER